MEFTITKCINDERKTHMIVVSSSWLLANNKTKESVLLEMNSSIKDDNLHIVNSTPSEVADYGCVKADNIIGNVKSCKSVDAGIEIETSMRSDEHTMEDFEWILYVDENAGIKPCIVRKPTATNNDISP